ncbi:hypothetical protein [Streptomyces gobiensis]|uniref:hypothetical protein n=1 Tax=Streptomyces gobiensis TaxID=2875706 RepID=UPI001E322C07|nr:hypothetical protein [Streptomyces gobiensis]UGY92857.1 hypothetical protein test1122_14850 [Streptomyces gobiensis]
MERRKGTAVAVAVVVLTTLAGAGCSGRGVAAEDTYPRDHQAEVARAADVLVRAGTSKARTAIEMVSGSTRLTIRGVGGFDYQKRVGRLTVTLPDGQQKPVTEVFTPETLYMKNRGAGVPDGKWVRVDTTTLPDGNLVTNGATDPMSAAELLRGARKVAYVGEKKLHGEAVRHYRGITDLTVAAKEASPLSRMQLVAAAKGFSKKAVPFDAFLDGQGRLRKVRHEFVFRNEPGDGVEIASTVALYAFGAPVKVVMPEPGDIYAGKIATPDQ